jgi:ketosteroid isomerase-like protein
MGRTKTVQADPKNIYTGGPMKSKLYLSLVGSICLAAAMGSHAQAPGAGTEKAITALENRWLESEKTNNPDLITGLFGDKYVATEPDGKLEDGAQTLADAKARKWTSAEYEDVKVQVYGDAAIATGGYKGKGTDSGKPFDEHLRWTDTWVKMPNGKWQLVASHYSSVK